MGTSGQSPVSIVTVSYNRRDNVRELFLALQGQTCRPYEIILVDNASTDGTADMVRRQFPWVKLLETGRNLNMVAYNLGLRAARGDYILVMDDDGLPGSDDWIAQVVARFEENPRLGAVCCTLRMRDTGRIAHDSPQFVPDECSGGGYPGAAYNGTGAGIRARALRQTQLYPWDYSIMYLELHLCTQLLAAGWQVRHYPEIEVWHSRPSGSSTPKFSYRGVRNYYWYVWQFYPWPQVPGETLHRLAFGARSVARGRLPARRLWRSTRDALLGARTALQGRTPITAATLAYLRRVRRHGNWHGLAPEVRPFDLAL
jgi:GT2 family glycosyltransferase